MKNILLIFTDQQRFDTIEDINNPVIKTPAINSLVHDGTTFTSAYTPCPVCVPARFTMHTGLMPHNSGSFDNGATRNDLDSFMTILNNNGYQTHGVGKMHFTIKDEPYSTLWGFESRDLSEEVSDYDDFNKYLINNGYDHVFDTNGVRGEMYYIPQTSQLPQKHHNTTWVADRSIDFIKSRDDDRPFFLMSSFIKPHPPFDPPTPWNKLYRAPNMPMPKITHDDENLYTHFNRQQNRYKYRDNGTDLNLIRTIKAYYYASVSFVDYNVGRIIDSLKEKGLYEDTMIIYTSDHGEFLGDYNCFGKRSFLDSAARIPMIVKSPDMESDVICDTPVNLADIYPTILGYAGIEPEIDCDGLNLDDVAKKNVEREVIYGQIGDKQRGLYMALNKDYKYIYSAGDHKEWLFSRSIDPTETHNLAYSLDYIKITAAMKKLVIDYLNNDDYADAVDDDDWREYPIIEKYIDPDQSLLYQDTYGGVPDIPGYDTTVK